jgi:superfamily II DNA or RNA helicase
MNQEFNGWNKVSEKLRTLADDRSIELNDGQAASLRELAKRLPNNGVIIADEVGMGKTRIAAAVARCVIEEGGRIAILVPPGLGYQWSDELRCAGVDARPILRSLWQYLQAWEAEAKDAPWFKESALVVSHSFTNWRLGESTAPWRWTLLPEMYAKWRKTTGKNLPKTTNDNKFQDWSRYKELRKMDCNDNWPKPKSTDEKLRLATVRAAFSVTGNVNSKKACKQERKILDDLIENTPWPGALTASEYGRNEQLRPWLERAVGLGMGVFDLVIVDEAHKSRGQDSGLNRLLEKVVLQSAKARCLAMTATPVELDATQWTQMLGRIHVDEISKAAATTAISNYAQAVATVRQSPSDKESREKYKTSAETFRLALNPYLLRRDKREDPAVDKFQKASGEGYHAYRREQEILIDTVRLTPDWKRAVCAAEALSFVTRQSDRTAAKRLRLTLGNGHGIAALIDQLQRDNIDDHKQTEADGVPENTTSHNAETGLSTDKRLQRAEWWQNVMVQPFVNDGSALFDHPAILAAVEEIESVCRQGEKVLVFGRFTRPMKVLVDLLNAREMLRCIDEKRSWPQSKVHESKSKDGNIRSEWPAIEVARRQLQMQGALDRNLLDIALAEQYQELENKRRNIRDNLIHLIEEGFRLFQGDPNNKQPDKRVRALFDAFKKTAAEVPKQDKDNDGHASAAVSRAMQELIGVSVENAAPTDFAHAFIDLVAAASDRDEGDADGDGQLDEAEASVLWADLRLRLEEEYNRPEGGYARLMYGETKPATRRFLQLAFNRKHGHPKVLVAQSLVGREGLNLQKACRTVVLLHPEWNPGVVEQQIGRVDRIGSLWEEKLKQAITDKQESGNLPRIEIRHVVFKGTYDEKNWQVLRDRWDDLRAQLHGIVISSRIAEKYSDAKEMVVEINDAAPNFSPFNFKDCSS